MPLPPQYLTFFTDGGGPSTLMEAIVAVLRATPAVAAALGDALATPKVFADQTFVGADLPYCLYTEPEEKPQRVWGGGVIGNGQFDLGVFARRKDDARTLISL